MKAKLRTGSHLILAIFGSTLLCCSDEISDPMEPMVVLHLHKFPNEATHATLLTTATAADGQIKKQWQDFHTSPFDVLGVRFPSGTRGPVTFSVKTYKDDYCFLSAGVVSAKLNNDAISDIDVNLQQKPVCDIPLTKLTVMLQGIDKNSNSVVFSSPPGIQCGIDESHQNCSAIFPSDSLVKLFDISKDGRKVWWSATKNLPRIFNPCSNRALDCLLDLSTDSDMRITALY